MKKMLTKINEILKCLTENVSLYIISQNFCIKNLSRTVTGMAVAEILAPIDGSVWNLGKGCCFPVVVYYSPKEMAGLHGQKQCAELLF